MPLLVETANSRHVRIQQFQNFLGSFRTVGYVLVSGSSLIDPDMGLITGAEQTPWISSSAPSSGIKKSASRCSRLRHLRPFADAVHRGRFSFLAFRTQTKNMKLV